MKGLEVYGAHDDNTPKPELSLGDVVENTSNSEEESTKTLSSLSEDTNTLQKQETPLDELTSSLQPLYSLLELPNSSRPCCFAVRSQCWVRCQQQPLRSSFGMPCALSVSCVVTDFNIFAAV